MSERRVMNTNPIPERNHTPGVIADAGVVMSGKAGVIPGGNTIYADAGNVAEFKLPDVQEEIAPSGAIPAARGATAVPMRGGGTMVDPNDNGLVFARVSGQIVGIRSKTPVSIQRIMIGAKEFDVAGKDWLDVLKAARADLLPDNALVQVVAENIQETPVSLLLELDVMQGEAQEALATSGGTIVAGSVGDGTGVLSTAGGRVVEAGSGTTVRSGMGVAMQSATTLGTSGSFVRSHAARPEEDAGRVIDVEGVPIAPGKAQVLLSKGHGAFYRQHLETEQALPLAVRRPIAFQLRAAFDRDEPIQPSDDLASSNEWVILVDRSFLYPLAQALDLDTIPADDLRGAMLAALIEAQARDEAGSLEIQQIQPRSLVQGVQ